LSNDTPAIECNNLTKSYGSQPALQEIDLQVKPEETLVVFGHNGAGKTTLIKLLSTIIRPSSGSILIDGKNIREATEKIRFNIGVVTHNTFLYNNLTMYDNLTFYSRMYDVDNYVQRINEVVSNMGILPQLYDKVGTLSRGMQQRLSIARAILHSPKLMLFDEPESSLDNRAVSMLWDSLRYSVNNNAAKPTIIFTTHNLERGFKECDRIIILSKGRIIFDKQKRVTELADLEIFFRKSLENQE